MGKEGKSIVEDDHDRIRLVGSWMRESIDADSL